MKSYFKYILIVISLFSVFNIHAQRKDSDAKVAFDVFRKCRERMAKDTANIRILYAFNALDVKDKSTWIDEGQLKIGKGLTQYSSHFEEVNEDSLAVWLNNHPKAPNYPAARWLIGDRSDYWIEYQYSNIKVKGNELEEWAAMPLAIDSENLMYSEPFPLQKWTLEKETKEICGYLCQKATCQWRGRDYVAWFAKDIPVSSGPWKFGGLPGCIMQINDSKNEYSWETVAVNKGIFPMFEPRRKKYSPSTREKVQKLQRELNENYIKTTGVMYIEYVTGKQITSRKHEYTPLELE